MAPQAQIRRVRAAVAVLAGGALAWRCLDVSFLPPAAPSASSRRAVASGLTAGLLAAVSQVEAYELPPLPYAYDALEPSIDKATMEFHHDKHHATYVTNINNAFKDKTQPSLIELQKTAIKNGAAAVRNNGGGVYNHNMFWLEMAPKGTGGSPSAKLSAAINEAFGSMDEFKAKFEAAGAPGARFGSGWVWLVVANGKLAISSTPNQDNPLMEGVEGTAGFPILGCDVWEHAYYLKYQNRRPDYIKAWWDVVNWNQVSAWYEDALGGKAANVDAGAAAAALVGQRKSPTSFSFKFGIEANAQFGN